MNWIRDNLKLVVIGGLVLLVIVGGIVGLVWSRQKGKEVEEIEQITVQKGDAKITLSKDGLLTVRIPEGIFQQQWDQRRVKELFERFKNQDFSGLKNYVEGQDVGDGYVFTITTADGRQVSFIVNVGDISIPDVIGEIIEEFEEVVEVTPTPIPTVRPTSYFPTSYPTPTPFPTYSFPTPIPTRPSSGDGGGTGGVEHFECEFYDPEANSDIISETVCTPE